MTALTPGCDPDMSTTGAPFGRPPDEPRVRSGLVLVAIVGLSAVLATAEAVPGAVAVPAMVVGALGGLLLLRGGIRLVRRGGSVLATAVLRGVRRADAVSTGAP